MICSLHALLPALIVFGYISILGHIREKLQISDWTLKKELLNVALIFLMIGLASFLLRGLIYTNPDNISWYYLFIEMRNAYLAGIIFCIYLVAAQVYFKANVNEKTAHKVIDPPAERVKEESKSSSVFIKAHVRIDDFRLQVDDLLFARAEGNYVIIYIFKDGRLQNELKRISLKHLETQVAAYPYLLRCHRAYLLNIKRVAKLAGNSQGYSISFEETEDKVPVSRTYLNRFDQIYNQPL
ncbi:LytTR family DNA-binding domain-containing protein [Pedobacter sp. L105]|uniref:LytR/AlgR family response regulator transcription factor n=1 Tax=Pedobacter sp. L105 TaxID=1641871 RepID=UPI00131BEC38|nr:LytTR family DNA-binding domain-containing protein [Pedobacter sp. L105]